MQYVCVQKDTQIHKNSTTFLHQFTVPKAVLILPQKDHARGRLTSGQTLWTHVITLTALVIAILTQLQILHAWSHLTLYTIITMSINISCI